MVERITDYDTPRPSPEVRTTTRPLLPPRWRKLLLTAHVAATVSALGAALVLLTLGISGLRGADPQTVYPAMHLVAAYVIVPLAVLALGTGVLQGLLTSWGLVRYWWVTIKLAITAVMTVTVLFVVVPGLGRAADAATGAAPEVVLTDAGRLTYVLTPSVATALLILNVALAIYKPAWRLRQERNGT